MVNTRSISCARSKSSASRFQVWSLTRRSAAISSTDRSRAASRGPQTGESGPAMIASTSSGDRPADLAIRTCCAHSYSPRRSQAIRTVTISRSRADSVLWNRWLLKANQALARAGCQEKMPRMLEAGRSRRGPADERVLPGGRSAASASSISASQSSVGLGGIRGSLNRIPSSQRRPAIFLLTGWHKKVLTSSAARVKV